MDINKLIDYAIIASKNAYVPYSNFKVGAALITKNGKIYTGCNIENASYGLSNCAERTCLFSSYADGVTKQDIEMFCVYSPLNHIVSPCGACRQVMSELLPSDCKIIIAYGDNHQYVETTMQELLPLTFTSEDLNND